MKYHKQQTLLINKYKVDRKSLLFYKSILYRMLTQRPLFCANPYLP